MRNWGNHDGLVSHNRTSINRLTLLKSNATELVGTDHRGVGSREHEHVHVGCTR